ncbi:MAG: hypothetical protein IIV23_07535, partial [Ruminococcus sp.]|nr:hypothetical protein [Ruminococcus sp.]
FVDCLHSRVQKGNSDNRFAKCIVIMRTVSAQKTPPLHADISTPHRVAGATIGRPQIGRRRFPRKNGMTENQCIMSGCVPTISIKEYRRSRAKAFSRGEGGTLPLMLVISK